VFSFQWLQVHASSLAHLILFFVVFEEASPVPTAYFGFGSSYQITNHYGMNHLISSLLRGRYPRNYFVPCAAPVEVFGSSPIDLEVSS
jgi:hypothetical protein